MKNVTSHTGKLELIERMPNSYFGNPRYKVRVDGWTCVTQVDSGLAYEIDNWFGKIVDARLGTHYGVCTIDTMKLNTEVASCVS